MIFVAFEFVGVAIKRKDQPFIPVCFSNNLQGVRFNLKGKLVHFCLLIAELFCGLTHWNKLTLHLCGIEIKQKVVIG